MIYINKKSGAFQDLNKKDFDKLSDPIRKQYREANEKEVESYKAKNSLKAQAEKKRLKKLAEKSNSSVVTADSKKEEDSGSATDDASNEETAEK